MTGCADIMPTSPRIRTCGFSATPPTLSLVDVGTSPSRCQAGSLSAMAPTPNYPIVTASEIEAALQTGSHGLDWDSKVERHGVCMSDLVGMTGLGVHFVRLDPGKESTVVHYHLHDSEYLYILSGSASLLLVDASLPDLTSTPSAPASGPMRTDYPVEERPLRPGDFVGFPGGINASKYAHGMRAGPEGVTYIMGGARNQMDVCCYPLVGVTRIFDHKDDKERRQVSDYPRFPTGP